ncbi:LOW QUALITY PROTEIN: hypothetical protein PHMEG_000512 [Phytophthora megakarya]|uniref:Uncharacterized protein n=1 Tax=Phytophthora megakarya TaxID=4795 RepID=A0A225X3F5_9STRA|nr:LOW QUALITY PROTEIN: hypothetical protein PHMEG_000512 [Phytophthora megakarya]
METDGSGGVRSRPTQREEETTELSRFSLSGMASGRGDARREMVHDLWTNKDEEKVDDRTVEIKEEKVTVKAEVPDTDVQGLKLDHQGVERFTKEGVAWKGVGDGLGDVETVKEEPARTPSGFISRYSGSESRLTSLGLAGVMREELGPSLKSHWLGGGSSPKVASGPSVDKTDAYRSLSGVGSGKNVGTVGRVHNRVLTPFQLDSLTPLEPNTLRGTEMSVPFFWSIRFWASRVKFAIESTADCSQQHGGTRSEFFSDSATVEKVRLLWNAFEANTEELPDQSRLLVFSQKLKG